MSPGRTRFLKIIAHDQWGIAAEIRPTDGIIEVSRGWRGHIDRVLKPQHSVSDLPRSKVSFAMKIEKKLMSPAEAVRNFQGRSLQREKFYGKRAVTSYFEALWK